MITTADIEKGFALAERLVTAFEDFVTNQNRLACAAEQGLKVQQDALKRQAELMEDMKESLN